ncbi:hypothetical protein RI367_000382 [Sorochytrium milnesiophthora]
MDLKALLNPEQSPLLQSDCEDGGSRPVPPPLSLSMPVALPPASRLLPPPPLSALPTPTTAPLASPLSSSSSTSSTSAHHHHYHHSHSAYQRTSHHYHPYGQPTPASHAGRQQYHHHQQHHPTLLSPSSPSPALPPPGSNSSSSSSISNNNNNNNNSSSGAHFPAPWDRRVSSSVSSTGSAHDEDDADLLPRPHTSQLPLEEAMHDELEMDSETRRKPYYTFNRQSYRLMCSYLALSPSKGRYPTKAEILAANAKELSRKRWRRLQGNMQLIPNAPMYRNLSWSGSPLVIVPKEDWRDVFLECHLTVTDDRRRVYHHGVQETFHKMKTIYQTRRSRCGITYDDLMLFINQCPCKPSHLRLAAPGTTGLTDGVTLDASRTPFPFEGSIGGHSVDSKFTHLGRDSGVNLVAH